MKTFVDRITVAISGTVVVSYLLLGSRWISHISLSNGIYLTDLLLFASLIWFTYIYFSKRKKFFEMILRNDFKLLIIFLLYIVIFFFFRQEFTLAAVRDVVPYIYTFIAVLSGFSFIQSSQRAKENTFRIILGALLLHAIWMLFITPNVAKLEFSVQDTKVNPFTLRPDIDTSLLGLLIAIGIYLLPRTRVLPFLILSGGTLYFTYALFQSETRGGLLGAIAALLLISFFAFRNNRDKIYLRKLIFLTCLVSLTALASFSAGSISPRIQGTLQSLNLVESQTTNSTISSSETLESEKQLESSSGTARARSAAWQTLADWSFSHPETIILGNGFGPNFMVFTGAGEALLGTNDPRIEEVRSPHNFLVGTYMRIGALGLLIFVSILGLYFYKLVQYIKRNTSSNLEVLAFAIVPCLLMPALVGVILESPFGAIPFWWALGIVFASSNSKTSKLAVFPKWLSLKWESVPKNRNTPLQTK